MRGGRKTSLEDGVAMGMGDMESTPSTTSSIENTDPFIYLAVEMQSRQVQWWWESPLYFPDIPEFCEVKEAALSN